MKRLWDYIKSYISFPVKDLLYSVRNVIGALLPVFFGYLVGEIEIGAKCTMGASFVFGVDREEPLYAKIRILSITALLTNVLTIIILFLAPYFYIKVVFLLLSIFLLAYVASLGVRYALMSFMGYLSMLIAISMTSDITYFDGIGFHVLWVFTGACWYIFFGVIFHLLYGKKPLIDKLDQLVTETAGLIQKRGGMMLSSEQEQHDTQWQLTELRMQITNTQAELREMLLSDVGALNRQKSKENQVMTGFIELVDMFEMAVATPVDFKFWHQWVNEDSILKKIPQVSFLMASALKSMVARNPTASIDVIIDEIEKLQREVKEAMQERNTENWADTDEKYQKIRRIQVYQKQQLDRLKNIYHVYIDEHEKVSAELADPSFKKFRDAHPLNRTALIDNFSFKSSTFRYALRTTITALAGYLLARWLDLENSYWVMLTVLVIMKPGYSVTKQRFYHRIIGTLVGALIALVFIALGVNYVFLMCLLGVSLILGLSYLNTNYVLASLFFTLFIVGLYGVLNQSLENVILYRFFDTLLGGVLCFLAIQLLFPFWEEKNIGIFIRQSMKENENYLKAVSKEVENKEFDLAKYRLARKKAFLAMSNLVASYKKMKTDPKRKQHNADMYAEVIMLNEALLSAISSLAVGVQRFQKHISGRDDLVAHFREVTDYFDQLQQGNIPHKPQALLSDEITLKSKARAELEQGEKGAYYLQYFHGKFVHEQLISIEELIYRLARMR